QPRHDDLLLEQEVPRLPGPAQAAAAAQQGCPLCHPPRGAQVVHHPGGLFVAGINLTENLEYILAHLCQSLKDMTLPNLPCLRAWVREQCPGPGPRCTNIIAGDFIGADGFVSDVIGLNQKLLWC
ncbi:PI-PLC X domain-containing protein 1 isoform 1, partial [Daubentonia madagascariensis]